MSETHALFRGSGPSAEPAGPAGSAPPVSDWRHGASASARGLPVDTPPPIVEPQLAAAEPVADDVVRRLSLVEFAEPAPPRRIARHSFLTAGTAWPEPETPPPLPTPPSAPYMPLFAAYAGAPAAEAGEPDPGLSGAMPEAAGEADEHGSAGVEAQHPADGAASEAAEGAAAGAVDPSAPWWRDIYAPPLPSTGPVAPPVPDTVGSKGRREGTRAALSRLRVRPRYLVSAAAAVVAMLVVSGAVGIGPLGAVGAAIWGMLHRADPAPTSTAPPTDAAARVTYFLDRAQAGDAQAQLGLAILYAKGEGVAQDYETAATWFRAAAQQGVARAQYDLGVLYERGRGVAVSYPDAFAWYLRAAENNYALAQYNLAVAYTRGQGTAQDFAAAATWYARAGTQNVVPAMVNLAILYERGEGVEASAINAYAWYRAAAQRGNQQAAKRADELFEVLALGERPHAEARAGEIARSIREPSSGLAGTSGGAPAPPAGTGMDAATGR